jgi:hypothetical protein
VRTFDRNVRPELQADRRQHRLCASPRGLQGFSMASQWPWIRPRRQGPSIQKPQRKNLAPDRGARCRHSPPLSGTLGRGQPKRDSLPGDRHPTPWSARSPPADESVGGGGWESNPPGTLLSPTLVLKTRSATRPPYTSTRLSPNCEPRRLAISGPSGNWMPAVRMLNRRITLPAFMRDYTGYFNLNT